MRKKCFNILGGMLLSFVYAHSYSQADSVNSETLTCLRLIYNCDFDKARIHYTNFPSTASQTKNLLEVFASRWQNIPIGNSPEKEIYRKALGMLVDNLKKEPPKEENLYLLITSQLLLTEFHHTQGDVGKALWLGKEAYPLIMKAFDENRKEHELLFIRAMYLYYSNFFRDKGLLYRLALFPFRDGNQELGLKLLQDVAQVESLAQTEALIYSAHILLHLENKPEQALPYSKKLVEAYPANLKFRELLIDNLIALKYFNEADSELEKQLETKSAYFKIPALYFAGCVEIEFRKNKAQAKQDFEQCIHLAGQSGLLEGYSEKAKQQLRNL